VVKEVVNGLITINTSVTSEVVPQTNFTTWGVRYSGREERPFPIGDPIMTAIAILEIIPVRAEQMSDQIAAAIDALDQFDISYEVTPMDTIIEADDVSKIFAAAEAAHDAIDEERIITSLEIDHQLNREQHTTDRVAAVERELGRSVHG
jgi:uncharacterized protein YqgV (UPF0045/DUF77 family)